MRTSGKQVFRDGGSAVRKLSRTQWRTGVGVLIKECDTTGGHPKRVHSEPIYTRHIEISSRMLL